jgi:hypothetical protein
MYVCTCIYYVTDWQGYRSPHSVRYVHVLKMYMCMHPNAQCIVYTVLRVYITRSIQYMSCTMNSGHVQYWVYSTCACSCTRTCTLYMYTWRAFVFSIVPALWQSSISKAQDCASEDTNYEWISVRGQQKDLFFSFCLTVLERSAEPAHVYVLFSGFVYMQWQIELRLAHTCMRQTGSYSDPHRRLTKKWQLMIGLHGPMAACMSLWVYIQLHVHVPFNFKEITGTKAYCGISKRTECANWMHMIKHAHCLVKVNMVTLETFGKSVPGFKSHD